MMFSYTVTEVESHQITVTFPDGSWAQVPVFEGESKEAINERVASFYHPPTEGYTTTSQVPFAVGEEVATEEVSHKPEPKPDPSDVDDPDEVMLTYKDLRRDSYPTIEEQLRSMYMARAGNPAPLEDMDRMISEIDLQYPSDMEPISRKEYNDLLNEASSLTRSEYNDLINESSSI